MNGQVKVDNNFSKNKGEIPVKEKEQNKKEKKIIKTKESPLYKKILEKFPDANLVDVISKDEKKMTDFNKILDKAKELEAKMKESQENIKKIKAEGISGANSVKVILDGNGEMQKIEITDELLKEENQ